MLTADTHSRHQIIDYQLGLHAVRIPAGDDPDANAATMRRLGAEQVVAVGQGGNDAGMLRDAALGICVLGPEGAAMEALMAADVAAPSNQDALDLLTQPVWLVATLRR